MKTRMTHASLCTGIGGFDYAASLLGWENVFQCEIDPFCRRVLRYWFPQCDLFSDIKTSDFTKYADTIDVLSAGFPCQPFSVAGQRKGADDDRYLWDEVLRAVREVRPLWFVGENVGGLLTQQSGVVFERVCADMEDTGYEVQPFVIPACAVGAPHRRDRVWIVAAANAESIGCKRRMESRTGRDGFKDGNTAADANVAGLERRWSLRQSKRPEQNITDWRRFPTQSPVCSRNDGLSFGLADIAFSRWRRESIKALGNAIVPQVAYEIFKAIEQI